MTDIEQERAPLPERDTALSASAQGVFRKFEVRRTDGKDAPGEKHHGCEYFVLDVTHDPCAKAALAAYADAVEETHMILAADMRDRYGLQARAQQPSADGADGVVAYLTLPCQVSAIPLAYSAEEVATSGLPPEEIAKMVKCYARPAADVLADAERFFPFEFEVWEDDEMYANTSGTREQALAEAMRYVPQYPAQVRVFEVIRKLIYAATSPKDSG